MKLRGARVPPGVACRLVRRTNCLLPIAVFGLVLALGGCGKPGERQSPAPLSNNRDERTGALHSDQALFKDVTAEAGLHFVHQLADGTLDNIMESDGAGGVCLDFDNDGFQDIYLVNSGPAPAFSNAPTGTTRAPNRLFRNRKDGTFEDVTQRAGVEGHGFGTTAAAADYDNDGYTDLLVVTFEGPILYHNNHDGTFSDVTTQAGLAAHGTGISAAFLDADQDGYLDLFLANYLHFDRAVKNPPGATAPYPGPLSYEAEFNALYRNRGDGTFEDISAQAGIRIPGHRAMSVTALDYDLDGDDDLYVSNDGTANLLLANDGKAHFSDVALAGGVALNQFGGADGSMGAAIGDCNADGWPDLFVTRFGKASLYLNSGKGFFEDRIQPAGILQTSSLYTGWGGNFLDFDNNGTLDLFIANGNAHFLEGMPPLLFENTGQALFRDARSRGGLLFAKAFNARGSAALDYDNDGRMDLLVTTLAGPSMLWRNLCTASNHWLKLVLEGSRGNRDAFGALVSVQSGANVQTAEQRCSTSYVTQQDGRLHFGLGQNQVAERVTIRWPQAHVTTLTNVAADQILRIVEPGESRWRPAQRGSGKP